jgi:hypothetical protein
MEPQDRGARRPSIDRLTSESRSYRGRTGRRGDEVRVEGVHAQPQPQSRGVDHWAREEELWRRREEEAALNLAVGRGRRGALGEAADLKAATAAREERWSDRDFKASGR